MEYDDVKKVLRELGRNVGSGARDVGRRARGIDREQIVRMLVGEPAGNDWVGPLFTGLGIGLLVGAAAALLLAPSSGEALRHDLGEGFDRLKTRFAPEAGGPNGHQGRSDEDLGG